jgi:hypothetical protein
MTPKLFDAGDKTSRRCSQAASGPKISGVCSGRHMGPGYGGWGSGLKVGFSQEELPGAVAVRSGHVSAGILQPTDYVHHG